MSKTSKKIDHQETEVGVCPDGTRFDVPETLSVMGMLTNVRALTCPAIICWLGLNIFTFSTILLYLNGTIGKWFFCLQFVFWRLAYNVGLGYILRTQSNSKAFVNLYRQHVLPYPDRVKMLEAVTVLAKGEYKIAEFPDELNAWMLYRFIVLFILALDLTAYFVLVVVCWKPLAFDLYDVMAYAIGTGLCFFALWSKADAHRVIGDFAWYWGDFFFLLDKSLIFDGIFQMFPHPMYTVGYGFMYGFALMAKSYTLFYMGLFGHLCQMVFLAFVENPHIDKTYNTVSEPTTEEKARDDILYGEGTRFLVHDEMISVSNFNPLRASDLHLALLLLYLLVLNFLSLPLWMYVAHWAFWQIMRSGVLGYVLHKQAKEKFLSQACQCPKKAFHLWKRLYNTAYTMTQASFAVCAYQMFQCSVPYLTASQRFFLFTVGSLLVAFNYYISRGTFEASGTFGFFYGDFFLDMVPTKLTYSGIYRYLNNPECTLGMTAYYGSVLISGSLYLLPLSIISHACAAAWVFLIESPFMVQKYGSHLRKAGGLAQELRQKANTIRQLIETSERKYANTRRLSAELNRIEESLREKTD